MNPARVTKRILDNQQIIEEFSSIYQTSQKQLDELIELQQLAQTINGENPRKTSLERYVLQVYLQEVLQVANSQLQRLTKNRYQFELAEEVGSYAWYTAQNGFSIKQALNAYREYSKNSLQTIYPEDIKNWQDDASASPVIIGNEDKRKEMATLLLNLIAENKLLLGTLARTYDHTTAAID